KAASNSGHGIASASCLIGWRRSSCSARLGIRNEIWLEVEGLLCIAPFDRILRLRFNFPVENVQAPFPQPSLPSTQIPFFRTDYGTSFECFYEGLYLFTKGDVRAATPLLRGAAEDDIY